MNHLEKWHETWDGKLEIILKHATWVILHEPFDVRDYLQLSYSGNTGDIAKVIILKKILYIKAILATYKYKFKKLF